MSPKSAPRIRGHRHRHNCKPVTMRSRVGLTGSGWRLGPPRLRCTSIHRATEAVARTIARLRPCLSDLLCTPAVARMVELPNLPLAHPAPSCTKSLYSKEQATLAAVPEQLHKPPMIWYPGRRAGLHDLA